MQGYRKTLKFLIPRNKKALGNFSLENRDVVPVYINPESISIRERKIINKQLTKGGYVVQYWGEELPTMSVQGTTGSAGVEGINILRDIYRNEQVSMKRILLERLENETESMIGNLTGLTDVAQKSTSFWGNVAGAFDNIGNIFEADEWIGGAKSVVDSWVSAFQGTADDAVARTVLNPSLGAFAVNIDLYFQGERFRGYFSNFTSTERASSQGLFNYNFDFIITKRMGSRTNFMPWHRSPTDLNGDPIAAAIPAGKQNGSIDRGLTYIPTYDQDATLRFSPNPDDLVTEGAFAGDSISDASEVEVSIDRRSNITEGD